MRLTDADIGGILVCTKAVSNLIKLQLYQMTKITGSGLAPLGGSTVLRNLDLSIVSLESEKSADLKPKLSQDAVIPILWSLLKNNGNSLKHIHLPKLWFDNQTEEPCQVIQLLFIQRFGDSATHEAKFDSGQVRFINQVKIDCRECRWGLYRHCRSTDTDDVWVSLESSEEIQCCPECKSNYCKTHAEWNVQTCGKCKETKCTKCRGCADHFHCDSCEETLCKDCEDWIVCDNQCDGWWEFGNCSDCEKKGFGGTKKCVRCNGCFCVDCKPMEYMHRFEGNVCADCQ